MPQRRYTSFENHHIHAQHTPANPHGHARSRSSSISDVASVKSTDTVIVGNGPAALFLSYLLHGNVPYYDPNTHGPHPDPVLHAKLSQCLGPGRPVYDAIPSPKAYEFLTEHFPASQMSYSNQALPVNVLLDTLVRPNADTEIGGTKSRIHWEFDPTKRVEHLALGSAPDAGGQWTEDPVSTNWEIGTLSYAELLSLPGYSFPEHYKKMHGRGMSDLIRPSRREVASYFSVYPKAVGIAPAIHTSVLVQRIFRSGNGFIVKVHRKRNAFSKEGDSYTILCKHIILASGIFNYIIPPPPIFLPLLNSPTARISRNSKCPPPPLLVVGSGFTAADVILSQKAGQKIIHIYKWNTSRASPLKGCHPQAYPEYAQIYRRMKLAVANVRTLSAVPPTSSQCEVLTRNWEETYEGFPNAQVISVSPDGNIKILTADGDIVQRTIGSLKYCVGRRGSLEYLSPELRKEVGVVDAGWVSAETMRRRVEADIEVARDVFAVGSLTGDSLVRYAFGGGAYAVGKILKKYDRSRGTSFENSERKGSVDKKSVNWGCVVS